MPKSPKCLKAETKELCRVFKKESRIVSVWLFGSQAKGEAREYSDIDLAILYENLIGLMEQIGIENEVERALGIEKVDFVNLNKVGLPFQHRVISEGKLIYSKDKERTTDFVEKVLIEYCDFEPLYKRYLEDYFKGIDERYGY